VATRIRHLIAVLCVAAILTPLAYAATAAPPAREIEPSTADRTALRAASGRYHQSTRVAGPLAGSVRLARRGTVQWAIATFSVPGIGLAGQPELLRRRAGEPWLDLGVVGPKLCGTPAAVLRAWELQKRARGCVSPLGGRTPPPLSD
jgi:hypothetical protein